MDGIEIATPVLPEHRQQLLNRPRPVFSVLRNTKRNSRIETEKRSSKKKRREKEAEAAF
ncbi:MAG: hypothetical protein KC652_23975 [Cyanobacteria bacterium HKST-UBA01]|nr:hypothetical protein [Cyanobacteria bacterium HKST-UBA01]